MLKKILFFVFILVFLFSFNKNTLSQSVNCATADPFCTGNTYNFPLATGTSSESGPDYGCLGTQPNPIWYYLRILDPGDITIHIQSSPDPHDVDFICWGPFGSATGACTAGLTAGNTVDCSYSTSDQEDCNISNALTGQYYMLLITNFSNVATDVVFSQTNIGAPNDGSTDCAIITPCDITAATANPSACSPGPNTYSVSGSITYVNQPATGNIIVTDQPSGVTQILPLGSTNYNLAGLNSDGAVHTVTIAFSADQFCTYTVNYTAPVSCNSCNADAGPDQSVCVLSATMAAVVQPGDYNMAWTYSGGVPGVTANNPNIPNTIVTVPSQGIYTFTWTITNQFGITCSDNVIIKFVNSPTSTFNFTPITCFDNNLATFDFTGTASPSATYSWNFAGGSPPTSNLTDGPAAGVTYITDGNHTVSLTVSELGCPSSTTTNTIYTPPDLVTTVNITPLPCSSLIDAFVINTTGGVSGYTYGFDYCGGCSTPPSSSGTHTVTTTDVNGCTDVTTFILNSSNPLTLTAVHTNLICNNVPTGTATVIVTNGSPGYTYAWSNNPLLNSANQNGMQANNYTVSVTDADGCQASINIGILQPPPFSVSTSNLSDASCAGFCDGSATAFGSGGTSPITYNWGTITTAINNSLCAGNNIVVATDVNGCTATDTAVISEPVLLTATISSQTDEPCFGGASGSATVSAEGGDSTYYQYSWTTGSPNQSIYNLSANTYGVVVTDASGCTASASVIITQPTLLGALILGVTGTSCFGTCDGTAMATGSGGTQPYSYNWGIGQVPTALCAGSHSVTVTDANLCTSSTTVNIIQPTPVTATITDTSSVSCFGGNNGDATVSGSGGTPGYTYSWNAGLNTTSPTNTGLSATTYTVTVYDSRGCFGSTSATITQPLLLSASASVPLTFNGFSISCFGFSDATINLQVTGGSQPYTYLWSNSALTEDLINVDLGTYNVIITDNHGCIANASATTTEPPLLTIGNSNFSNVTCNGFNDGTISVPSVSGGVLPYQYSIITGIIQNSPDFTNLDTGLYTLTVTDNNGCIENTSFTITEPLVLGLTNASTDVLCSGGSDGTASLTIYGGTSPYNVLWSNNAITPIVNNLSFGIYTATVTDDNGCTIQSNPINISQPQPLLITLQNATSILCFGDLATISVIAGGGTNPLSYSLNLNTPTANGVYSNLPQGIYSVTILDNNNCSITSNIFTIAEPPLLLITDSSFINITCNGYQDGIVSVPVVTGGTPSYKYSIIPGITQISNTFTNLDIGNYTLTVIDDNGCKDSTRFTLTEPTVMVSTKSSTNVNCFGGSDGTASINTTGGTLPYNIFWSNGAITTDVINLAIGIYFISVTDDHNCSTSDTVIISQPTKPYVTSSADTIICKNTPATLTANATGGTQPYKYYWNGIQGMYVDTLSLSSNTTINVFVIDANGCLSDTVKTNIGIIPDVILDVYTSDDSVCLGTSVNIYWTATGGNGAPYTVTDGQNIISFPYPVTPMFTQTYTFYAYDNLCPASGSDTINIFTIPLPTIDISADNFKGCQPFTVNFSVETNPVCSGFMWNFGEQDAISYTKFPQHVYENDGIFDVGITVTSIDGCTNNKTVPQYITVYPKPESRFDYDPEVVSILKPEIFFTNYSTSGTSNMWSFGDGDSIETVNPSHIYNNIGQYNVLLAVETGYGCKDTSIAIIMIKDEIAFYVPTAFSPNNDGINDIFLVKGHGIDPTSFLLNIYDRWGEPIFTSNKLEQGWNGSVKNGPNATGDTYVWMVSFKDIIGKKYVKSGYVILIK